MHVLTALFSLNAYQTALQTPESRVWQCVSTSILQIFFSKMITWFKKYFFLKQRVSIVYFQFIINADVTNDLPILTL